MKFTDYMFNIMTCGSWCSTMDDPEMHGTSEVLSKLSESRVAHTALLKTVFMEVDVVPVRVVGDHTHGESAANRSTASLIIDRLGSSSGREVVFFQGSSADVRNGRKITRTKHWAKDAMAPLAQACVDDDNIIAMVDVDYYVDMDKFLIKNFNPVIMYTFQPTGVCKDSGEYKYTFNSKSEVEYTVSGGGSYTHPVWNWDGDSLVAKRNLFGFIPWKRASYAIERRRMDDDHQLVLLCPLEKYSGPFACWLADRYASARALARLKIVEGNFLRLRVNDKTDLWTCTGRVGGYTQARVPARVDDAIASTRETLSGKLQLFTVKSKMEDNVHSSDKVKIGAEVLLEYHLQGKKQPTQVSAMNNGVRRFQWTNNDGVDPDSRPSMVSFMKPLVDGGFVPDSCIGNDQRSVDKRVLALKHTSRPVDNFTSKLMDEFVNLFLGGKKHFLEPTENDFVYEKQCKPTQKRILDNAQHATATRSASNFQKGEAYPNVNDPRMITQINGVDKMAYSAYIYALCDVLKTMPWYAFGKSNVEIAGRVAFICQDAQFVDNTDFSRMDGNVDECARTLEKRLMSAAFKSDYLPELFKLMKNQYGLYARTKHGVEYESGLARSSGSAETSSFNTILTAFICYSAYRRARNKLGAFNNSEQSWLKLGMYGGDDGVSANLDRSAVEKAAESMGQKLTLERVKRGERGVSFLARRYGPDVWFGDLNSCCDIKRQVSKFHLTTHLPGNVSVETKLREKAFAFKLSDKNTPVIGAFVKKVLRLMPMRADQFQNLIGIWNIDTMESSQYPNIDSGWMYDVALDGLPEFDFDGFDKWLENATRDDLFNCPGFTVPPEPKPKVGKVVVDGDLLSVSSSTVSSDAVSVSSKDDEPKRKKKFSRPSKDEKIPPRIPEFRPRKKKAVKESLTPKEGGWTTVKSKKPRHKKK